MLATKPQPTKILRPIPLLHETYRTPESRINKIIEVVSHDYRITKYQLLGKAKPAEINEARQIAMWLAVRLSGGRLYLIANSFGGRDCHAARRYIRSVEGRMETEPQFKASCTLLYAVCHEIFYPGQSVMVLP